MHLDVEVIEFSQACLIVDANGQVHCIFCTL